MITSFAILLYVLCQFLNFILSFHWRFLVPGVFLNRITGRKKEKKKKKAWGASPVGEILKAAATVSLFHSSHASREAEQINAHYDGKEFQPREWGLFEDP